MPYLSHKSSKWVRKTVSAFLAAFMIISLSVQVNSAAESPEYTFTGHGGAAAVSGMAFTDVENLQPRSRDAVYEAVVLGILEPYSGRSFRPNAALSREEALSAILKAAGRLEEALTAAEAIAAAEDPGDEDEALTLAFLRIAMEEGLITPRDYEDALSRNQDALRESAFRRRSPVQRQEFAFWLAKALKLQPVVTGAGFTASVEDLRDVDEKIKPYLEAVLQEGIMVLDSQGRFLPAETVTREDGALIFKNAEEFFLPLMGMEKRLGTVEKINESNDYSGGSAKRVRTIDVRSSSGKLHRIVARRPLAAGAGGSGAAEIAVYMDGRLGDSLLLKEGYGIEYITDANGRVLFVKVVSRVKDTRYIVGEVVSLDTERLILEITPFFTLQYPYLDMDGGNASFDIRDLGHSFNYSAGLKVLKDGRLAGLEDVKPGVTLMLTVENGLVTSVELVRLGAETREGVVKGIVQENNPAMGYITLYFEDGTGVSEELRYGLFIQRTYNYGQKDGIEVFKNHQRADLEDIEAGDTVFLKLGEDGNVISVSGVDNYTVKYGKVLTKLVSGILVEYEDGRQQYLAVGKEVPVLSPEAMLVGLEGLKEGDRVRLLLNITEGSTVVKEITVERNRQKIAGIYKGVVSHVNTQSGRILLRDMEQFRNGQWQRTEHKGYRELELTEDCRVFLMDRELDLKNLSRYYLGSEAYIAVAEGYGGKEKAAMISLRNSRDKEMLPRDDKIAYAFPGSGEFGLSTMAESIKSLPGTIIVKDSVLVSARSISADDQAYVVPNRSYANGEYYAGVVQIGEKTVISRLEIYRGRIKSINTNRDFTVESFSLLDGLEWEYYNTPRTFRLDFDTRIITDSGLVNHRDFVDYGGGSYKNRTVYVVADGEKVLLVSTAPFGARSIRGEIIAVTGGTTGEEGTVLEEPTGFNLLRPKRYDPAKRVWTDMAETAEFSLVPSSIILKGDRIIKPSELRPGDRVRVLKSEDEQSREGYIIIVE